MVRKIKICPKCKTWTAGKGEYCGDCGETLIETGYTDMFFEKLSLEEQNEYVQKALNEKENETTVKTTEMNISHVPLTDSMVVGKALQIIGDIILFAGLLVAFAQGKNVYGEFSVILFLTYFMIGVTAGLLVNGLGHIIILLNKIIRNMAKE